MNVEAETTVASDEEDIVMSGCPPIGEGEMIQAIDVHGIAL